MNHGTTIGNQIPQTSAFNRKLTRPTTSSTLHPFSSPSRSRTTGRLRAVSVAQSSCGTTVATFYDLLGVPESGTLPEIKQAYRKLAMEYHPDVSPAEHVKENTEKFIELQEAYEILCDPNKRASYDRHLVSGLHLAFSCRNQFRDKQFWEGGRSQWEYQVAELRRRSMDKKDLPRETSWAARMRRQNCHQDDVV